MSESTLICHHCGAVLHPGSGDHYLVQIEACADPSGPIIDEPLSREEAQREIEELVSRMRALSPQEAMDQVYRRLTLHLCTPCYNRWIENPTGG